MHAGHDAKMSAVPRITARYYRTVLQDPGTSERQKTHQDHVHPASSAVVPAAASCGTIARRTAAASLRAAGTSIWVSGLSGLLLLESLSFSPTGLGTAAGDLTIAQTMHLPGAEARTTPTLGTVVTRRQEREPTPPASGTASAGGGGLTARAEVVSPPEPDAGILPAGVERLRLSRIETDYANLLSLAMSLEKMARDEIVRLSNERPNDPYTIQSNKKLSDLLSILADGFTKLAAALVEYAKQPQPFFAGKAKEVVDEVAAQVNVWWKANGAQVIDWGIRLPVIIASTGLLGWAGANMTVATTAVSALVGGPNVITAIKVAKKRTKRP